MLLGVPSGDPPPAVATWLRARMREAVPATAADVRAFVERALDVRATSVREASGGLAGGRTFLVEVPEGPGYVVKLAPRAPLAPPTDAFASAPAGPFADHPAAALRRGAVVARHVADATRGSVPVPVPVVVADADVGAEGVPFPAVVADRLPGDPLGDRYDEASPATRTAVARQVGRAVATVHRAVRFEGFGALAPVTDRRVAAVTPAAWSTVVVDELRPLARLAAGTPAADVVDRAFAAVTARRDLLDSVPGAALVHGDLRLDNLLVADGALAGVLDWDLAAAGDPAFDHGRAERALVVAAPPDERGPIRDAFASGYAAGVGPDAGSDPTFRRRSRLYAVARLVGTGLAFRVPGAPASLATGTDAVAGAERDLATALRRLDAAG